jgi:hypothetical protein
MGGTVGKFFGLALAVVVAVALADLVAHPQGTSTLTSAAVKAQTSALNAELGKTS